MSSFSLRWLTSAKPSRRRRSATSAARAACAAPAQWTRGIARGPTATPFDDRVDGTSPFPPIADYAFLSDCHTAALVAPDGTVEWLCPPRFDSPSVFAAILDRGAGGFRLGPSGMGVPAGRRYEPGTNVLETTWQTRDRLGGRARRADRRDAGASARLARRRRTRVRRPTRTPTTCSCARSSASTARSRSSCCASRCSTTGARPGSGARSPATRRRSTPSARGGRCACTSDLQLGIEGGSARARHRLAKGDRRFCALSWSRLLDAPRTYAEADASLGSTAEYWRNWLDTGRFPDHRWRAQLQRSALVLKGLTYAPTGAVVAAPTTSLPETPGGERNWDYRFTWMRDATLTLWGLSSLGLSWEADDFIQYVADLERNSRRVAADHVRRRRRARPDRADARPPHRLRGRPAGADRQRGRQPAPERRLRRGARLALPAHQALRPQLAAAVAGDRGAGRARAERLASSPTRASGRRAASRATTCPRS